MLIYENNLRPVLKWGELPSPQKELRCYSCIPREADCLAIWNTVGVPEHIRSHCELVAAYALSLGQRLVCRGVVLDLDALYASALLHDIAKRFCIENGGNHAQLGAAWTVQFTGEPLLAQGVLHHVSWPWEIDFAGWPLPLLVQYADKRIMHNRFVDIDTRFDDLAKRYGHIELMHEGKEQAKEMERQLIINYNVKVDENFTYNWRLTKIK